MTRRARDRIRREQLRHGWGRPFEREGVDPARPLRESMDAAEHERLDDQTWRDLLLDQVVSRLDRTITAAGSQALYRWARRPLLDADALRRRHAVIEAMGRDPALREEIQTLLLDFGVGRGKHLPRVLWGRIDEPEVPLPVLRLLPVALVGSIVAGILLPSLPLLGLGAAIFVANIVIHNRASYAIAPMMLALEDVGRLVMLAQRLVQLPSVARTESLRPALDELAAMLPGTRSLVRRTTMLHFNDPFDLSEYLKTVLLLEVIRFYGAARLLRRFQPQLRRLLDVMGDLDAAQSAASLREDPATCIPRIDASDDATAPPRIHAEDLRNPLLARPVGNDLLLPSTCLLVSGSNMSGKTTFLRTVATNAVLAQSLCVVYGTSYRGAPVRVASCIGIADDLLSGRSYYRAELDAILRIVRGAEAGPCLVVLDEIFRGTNPLERTAAAVAVLQHLAGRHLVLAATHDLEIGEQMGGAFSEAHFCEVATEDGELDFDYRLRPGRIERPNAIALLARTGFPDDIVQRAMHLVEAHATQTSKMLPRPNPASNTGLREARSRP
ncbi:hypothetical protein [Nannocystis sp. SCPEA4]|uniref:MutS-related protein n=1 Tax=Nannocystis sp. SCPEA4 TaxID=2996787 RepID=UPI00226D62BA|nr:hypothetical protein [Nannocystis sp. SCPEA4]